jgi:hypothetical protein
LTEIVNQECGLNGNVFYLLGHVLPLYRQNLSMSLVLRGLPKRRFFPLAFLPHSAMYVRVSFSEAVLVAVGFGFAHGQGLIGKCLVFAVA